MDWAQLRNAFAERKLRASPGIGHSHAAVAVILCGPADRPEVLLIERARHADDPWSGQMAFPGGHYKAQDSSIRYTAERETREEIAVDLGAAEYLGQLDDEQGRSTEIIVHGFVYYHPRLARWQPNQEVQAVHRVSLAELAAQRQWISRSRPGQPRDCPGIRLGSTGERVIWGLTYRFLDRLFTLIAGSRSSTAA